MKRIYYANLSIRRRGYVSAHHPKGVPPFPRLRMDGDHAWAQPLSLKRSVEITENLARLSTASYELVLSFSAPYPDPTR